MEMDGIGSAATEIDRISGLPDDLLHEILSRLKFCGGQTVQTSVLSRRWRWVWATLPNLEFYVRTVDNFKLVNNFLSKRDHNTAISKLICCTRPNIRPKLMNKVANYAISDNVQELELHSWRTLSADFPLRRVFSSPSLKKLELKAGLPELNSECRNLRSTLTTLDLGYCSLPDFPWSFPVLTTLNLSCVELAFMSWSLPALKTLHLHTVTFLGEKGLSFDNFPRLKILDLCSLPMWYDVEVFSITCPTLTHLKISDGDLERPITCKFVISTTKLSYFGCHGYSPISLFAKDGFPCLEIVDIDIPQINTFSQFMLNSPHGWDSYMEEKKDVILPQLISMFQEVRGAQILTLSFSTIKVLSSSTNILEQQPSPFGNLKCLKLEEKWKYANSTIPDHVRIYLISSSPSATVSIKDSNGIRNYNPEVKSDAITETKGY